MQRERQKREEPINSRDLFEGFGDFPSHRNMVPSIFGGRDPFDDPFFNRPFGSMFEPSLFDRHGSSDDLPNASSSKGLVIEELDTDDEGEEGKNGDPELKKKKTQGGTTSSNDPLIEHPDDEEEASKDVRFNNNHSRIEGTKPQTQSVSFKKVTYGGINGAYYTATTTRKSDSDGVVLEESKQADRTTGQATHRISKGIHDKGHSVTRNLDTDGKVDTVQTLHNLNEDELAGFEQAWKGNADRQLPGWNDGGFDSFGRAGSTRSMPSFGFALPSTDHSQRGGRTRHDNEARASSSGGRTKKVVTINIE